MYYNFLTYKCTSLSYSILSAFHYVTFSFNKNSPYLQSS
uniref:Uncharacterized protein n=1 Tax=Anguilla anguilla TaxID=7936 RepID=A0A0E9V251_ANGAN